MDGSPPVSSVHGDSPGKNTGMGCHFLLQGISSTQGSNPASPVLVGRFFTTRATWETQDLLDCKQLSQGPRLPLQVKYDVEIKRKG